MIWLILLLGLGVRLINLNQSLWLDEAITALAVKNNSLIELISRYSPGDFHPPLYYLFLKLWTNLFGYSEITLRIPSVIFGIITIFFIYKIAQKLFNQRTALLAGLLAALSPLALYYSQEARMYSLAAFLVTASVYFYLKKQWFWYFLFFALAMYSDYVPWLLVPFFLFQSRKNVKLLIAHCSLLILLLPWLPFLLPQLISGLAVNSVSPQWGMILGRFEWKALPLTWVKFIIGRISMSNKLVYGLVSLLLSIIYLAIASRSRLKILWSWLLIPLILGLLISIFVPIYSFFRFLFVLPAFILLLAGGVRENRWLSLFVISVSTASLIIFNLTPNFQRENWREAAMYFQKEPGVIVMPSLAQSAPIKYYYPEGTIIDQVDLKNSQSFQTVYLVRYVQEIFDPQDSQRKSLELNGFQKISERSFNGVLVWKYFK